MIPNLNSPAVRLSRRSLLAAVASTAALAVIPRARFEGVALSAQTPIAGSGAFFDPSTVHIISANFDKVAYDAVIQAYVDSGEKEWLEATLTIDGQTLEQVGLRLKGNSSLMSLRGPNAGDGGPVNIQREDPATSGTPTATFGSAGPAQDPSLTFVGGSGGSISADEPEGLPWLVRLDKFIDDQNLSGLTEFVIRSNNSETALNEALSLDLLAEAGLASQLAAYFSFSTNDSEPRLRLAIENPDDRWLAEHFSTGGTLFKAEAGGNWSYRDADYASYTEAFDLEAGGSDDNAANYAPLISFLDFLNNSDDVAFAAELPTWIDIDRFADYLAMMDLLHNDDDIDGPGNNAYLYYDPVAEQFTVVPWDMNLAFGGLGMTRFEGEPGNASGSAPAPPPGEGPRQMIIDGTPVAVQDIQGEIGPGTADGNGPRVGMGGPGGINNPLVQRWTAVDTFAALQQDAETRLRGAMFDSGVAAGILSTWVDVLETHATDLVEQSAIESDAKALKEQIDTV